MRLVRLRTPQDSALVSYWNNQGRYQFEITSPVFSSYFTKLYIYMAALLKTVQLNTGDSSEGKHHICVLFFGVEKYQKKVMKLT